MTLKGCLKTLVCSTAVLLPAMASTPAVSQVPAGVMSRTLHFVYARTNGKAFQGNADASTNHSDPTLLNAFDAVPGGVTALIPFTLNVTNMDQYAPFITSVKNKGIVIMPGVGGDPDTGERIDSTGYKAMARSAKPYTDYIRLENMQGYLDRGVGGRTAIQNMIDALIGMGYQHIMLNPWPVGANGLPVPFTNTQLDSTIYQVRLTKVSTPQGFCPDHSQDATNWGLPASSEISDMLAYKRVKILINYESAPQHEALSCLERQNPGSSKAALHTTVVAIQNYTAADLHWSPPFTTAYDPLKWGTWTYEANQLGLF